MTAAEDFGHEPTTVDKGRCGGCEHCGDREEREVCQRCLTVTRPRQQVLVFGGMDDADGRLEWGNWPVYEDVLWPCASAVALGLAERNDHA